MYTNYMLLSALVRVYGILKTSDNRLPTNYQLIEILNKAKAQNSGLIALAD